MAKKNPTTRQSKGKGRQNILERINLHAACIDIGAHFHFVAVGEDCTEENVRKFDTTDVFWIESFMFSAGYSYEAIHMIRKGPCCRSAGAKVGLLHRLILGLFAATS
jgi:hypothetical protein